MKVAGVEGLGIGDAWRLEVSQLRIYDIYVIEPKLNV